MYGGKCPTYYCCCCCCWTSWLPYGGRVPEQRYLMVGDGKLRQPSVNGLRRLLTTGLNFMKLSVSVATRNATTPSVLIVAVLNHGTQYEQGCQRCCLLTFHILMPYIICFIDVKTFFTFFILVTFFTFLTFFLFSKRFFIFNRLRFVIFMTDTWRVKRCITIIIIKTLAKFRAASG